MVNNFTRYQQNKQSPHTFTHYSQNKETTTYDVGNPCLGFGQVKNVVGLNRLLGSQPSSFDNWISNSEWWKTCTDSLPIKKITYYHNDRGTCRSGERNTKYMQTLWKSPRFFLTSFEVNWKRSHVTLFTNNVILWSVFLFIFQ